MRSRGRIYLLAVALIVVVLGGAMLALRPVSSATGATVYGYPPNARQLIAAGLSGRPAPHSRAWPVVVDRVLVDGIQTIVWFHL